MPTTTVKTIGTGRDYSTIQAWEDACPANLVSTDQIWKGLLYDEGGGTNGEWTLTAGVVFSGCTTDATRYVWLDAASGKSFADNANKLTNALRYNNANGVAIKASFSYGSGMFQSTSEDVRISRLQIRRQAAGGIGADQLFYAAGSGSVSFTIENCIGTNEGNDHSILISGATRLEIKNSVFYSASVSGKFLSSNASSASASVFAASTFYGGGSAEALTIAYTGTAAIVQDCGFFNWTSIGTAARFNSGSSSNNATNLSSFPFGSSNQVSLTTANQFENVTSGSQDFRVKTGATLIGNGVRAQTFTGDVDIVGTARSTGTAPSGPSIGAWEYPLITYTYARPTSDITTQWTTSSGSTHYTLIDESVADDADYIVATATGQTDEVKLASMTPPQVGTNLVINYKVTGVDGGATVTVSLRQGSGGTLIKTDTAKSANGTYALTVAPGDWAAVTDWSDMRLRFVSA